MTGKEKCATLKKLREKIAKDNGIAGFEYKECHYKGPCRGTCPSCDAEGAALAFELQKIGKYRPAEPLWPYGVDDNVDLMGILEQPALMGEMTASKDWVSQDIMDTIKDLPEDFLSGKLASTKNIRRGKIRKDCLSKERVKDDKNERCPRGLRKSNNKGK